MWKMQIGVVEYHVVCCVFSILHRAEYGVGTAVQHDVKRTKVHMTLVAEREQNDEHGGDELHQQHGRDEPEGD